MQNVETLQKRVAAEHAAMLQLQAELRSAKAQLSDSQVGLLGGGGPLVWASAAACGRPAAPAVPCVSPPARMSLASHITQSPPPPLPSRAQVQVEKEKGLLVAAKDAALAAKKEAAEAAAAAHAAELALRGQAGLETLKVGRGGGGDREQQGCVGGWGGWGVGGGGGTAGQRVERPAR